MNEMYWQNHLSIFGGSIFGIIADVNVERKEKPAALEPKPGLL